MAKQRLNYMYRKEFVAEFGQRTGITVEESDRMVTAFLELLQDAWEQKRSVCFANFGIFELRMISEKVGRNPRTMEEHLIPVSYKPTFRPTKMFRETITRAIRSDQASNDQSLSRAKNNSDKF